MAVTIDNSTYGWSSGVSTYSYQHISAGGPMLVAIGVLNNSSEPTASYGGTALTKISSGAFVITSSYYSWVFYHPNSPAGTTNVEITFNSSAPKVSWMSVTYLGANTTTPFGATGYAESSVASTKATTLVTCPASGIVQDFLVNWSVGGGTSWAPGASQTAQIDVESTGIAGGNPAFHASYITAGTSMAWFSTAADQPVGRWQYHTIPVNPTDAPPVVTSSGGTVSWWF